MSLWKGVIALVLLAVVVVFAYDGSRVLSADRDVRSAASATAGAAARAIASTKDRAKARSIADATAKARGDTVTDFSYDPVAATVSVTVSGKATSLVLHYVDNNLTDNIRATATARP